VLGSYRGADACNAGQVAYLLYSVEEHGMGSARKVAMEDYYTCIL
jgi:hypothetical protein